MKTGYKHSVYFKVMARRNGKSSGSMEVEIEVDDAAEGERWRKPIADLIIKTALANSRRRHQRKRDSAPMEIGEHE
jgi:hypothetical protein